MANQMKAAVRSGMGRIRTNNEDAYYFNGQFPTLETIDTEAAVQGTFSLQDNLFGVSDGIGGAFSGEVASTKTVAHLETLQKVLQTERFADAIIPWTREVNRLVSQAVPGGGCTIAMVYVNDQALHVAHVGDSRVYRLHQGQLICMTKDHSKVQMLLDAGMITPKEAAVHPQRHMVVRYIGMDEEENGICTASVARPMPLIHGDRYLICTDGVTDMLDSQALTDLLAQNKETDTCAQAIYDRALGAGGLDNTTLIVLDVEVPEVSPQQRMESLEEDVFETTLGSRKAVPQPLQQAETSQRLHVTQTYQMPSVSGKKLVIRSEISIQP